MCGIAGIVGPRDNRLVSPERVKRMIASMRHRGPDDNGIWAPRPSEGSRWFGVLGGCRLAIQDLSAAGHQPMIDPVTGAGIVFNGEIYNFRDLQTRLLDEGIPFHSNSDTEVVLRL